MQFVRQIDYLKAARLYRQFALEDPRCLVRPYHVRPRLAGSCEQAVSVQLTGRPYTDTLGDQRLTDFQHQVEQHDRHGVITKKTPTIFISMEVRCRKCKACLEARRKHWEARVQTEMASSPDTRTWFVTLTVRPDLRARAVMYARAHARRRGVEADFDSEEGSALRLRYLAKQFADPLTNWLKRLRRQYTGDVRFRYLLVAEPHSDGFPHFHVLIHERVGALTKRRIEGKWPLGHVSAKLAGTGSVDRRNVGKYIAKYCSKQLATRVRASKFYGKDPEGRGNLAVSYQHPQSLNPQTRVQSTYFGIDRTNYPNYSITSDCSLVDLVSWHNYHPEDGLAHPPPDPALWEGQGSLSLVVRRADLLPFLRQATTILDPLDVVSVTPLYTLAETLSLDHNRAESPSRFVIQVSRPERRLH